MTDEERQFRAKLVDDWQERQKTNDLINKALAGGPNPFNAAVALVVLAVIFLLMRSM